MKAGSVLVMMCVLAGQEIHQAPDAPVPITEQVKRSPLTPSQKDQVSKALEGHEYKTAETILVQAINSHPKSADLLIFAAHLFLLDKNPMNAAIALKKAEKIRPLAPDDHFQLAMAYIGMGKGEWARPELNRLADAAPNNPLYPYWLARIDYDQHKYGDAVRRLRSVTKANPGFIRAWDNLGLSLEGAGQIDESISSYRQAVRLNREQVSRSPWPPLNLGALLTRMGQVKEAEDLIREALTYNEQLAEAHHRLGVNLRKQGQDQPAIVELRRAIELDPSAPEPLYTLGQIYRDRGDSAAAAEAFERFKALKSSKRGT